MPIITCPKCQGKLRFPDDSPPRRVKCPTCGHTFMSSEGIDPKDPFHSAASRPDLPKARDSKGEFDLPMDDDRSRRGRDYDDEQPLTNSTHNAAPVGTCAISNVPTVRVKRYSTMIIPFIYGCGSQMNAYRPGLSNRAVQDWP